MSIQEVNMYPQISTDCSSPSSQSQQHHMSISGIQGHPLEVTVVGCNRLKDTEWISRQDPYVCLEYGTTKFRTRTCTDGGKNPTFQEKFTFTLIEGLREMNVSVWNSNTLTFDDFIGTGKIQLQKVLTQGFDDTPWTLQTKTGRFAGEVRLVLHYPRANKLATSSAPSAPIYGSHAPQQYMYSAPPLPTVSGYAPPPAAYSTPPTYPSYPPPPAAYPMASAYPPPAYPPPSAYPTAPYPPPPGSPYGPPGSYPGHYPPPPPPPY